MDPSAAGSIIQVLQQAASPDQQLRTSAQRQLEEWEGVLGFYPALLCIFTDKETEEQARWLAIICLKNCVDRNWRKTAPKAVSAEERNTIRSMLLENFHEPAPQLAVQLAVVIGKIARLDCPREWPELLPTLVGAISTETDERKLHRILLSFYQVVNCLSTRRLARDRKEFEELTKKIFDFVVGLWTNQMAQFQSLLGQGDVQRAHLMLQYAHLVLKVLRKLSVYGFKNPKECDNFKQFLQNCFYGVESMVEAGRNCAELINLGETWSKTLILYTKILCDVLQYHPEAYVSYIVKSLQLVCQLCFADPSKVVNCERFNVNLLNLMKDMLNNDSYRPQTVKISNETEGFALTAYKIIRSTMTESVLENVLQSLVYVYLPLTTNDLELWDSDPEEYVNEEGGDSYKYSIRACVETLFATLFKEFKPVLTPMLLGMVRETETPCDPNDINTLLRRDALYCAFGLAAYDVYDDVDFDSWLQNHLLPELLKESANCRVIRRRLIWLIGSWVNAKLSVAARPLVYQAIQRLLADSQDLVVRIEAALTLKLAVDDFEFSYHQFSPYIELTFDLLFKLLSHVQSCDSKMQILHVMSFIIERAGSDIGPHCDQLIHALPKLWMEAADHNMFRCAIVTALTGLVHCLGTESSRLHDIILPVIRLSTDMKQKDHVYLLEDGLLLWQATLYNSNQCSLQMLELFLVIPTLIDLTTEHLQICLKLIGAYALLCGQELLLRHGVMLVECICSLITDIKSEGVILVMKTVEIFFKLHAAEASGKFKQLFLSWIIPSVLEHESFPMVMSLYLCITSRLVLHDCSVFLHYVEEFSPTVNKLRDEVLTDFLVIWFENLDNISQSERRKVCALAVATFIPSQFGTMQQSLDAMVNACVQVMHDVCTSITTDGSLVVTDSVCMDQREMERFNDLKAETAHHRRKQMVCLKDLVFHVKLDVFVWTKLNELCTAVGAERFQQLMASIDPDITSQLQNFIKHLQPVT